MKVNCFHVALIGTWNNKNNCDSAYYSCIKTVKKRTDNRIDSHPTSVYANSC